MQLYQVLYCSRNVVDECDRSANEIDNILAKSRANNVRDGITGGLLFTDGCFAQVLEGPFDAVEQTFDRIQCDERHRDITVLQSGRIAARDFPDWSMGFAGAAPNGTVAAAMLSRRTTRGDDLLRLLKDIVRREHEWLAPLVKPHAA